MPTRSSPALPAPRQLEDDMPLPHDPGAHAVAAFTTVPSDHPSSGTGLTLVVQGEIDHASGAAFAAALAPLVTSGGVVEIDLSGVGFMGSAGVRVLRSAVESLGHRGCVQLRDPSAAVRRVIDLMDVGTTFAADQRR